MDTSYFGFSEAPFEEGPDERFLFFSTPHREVTAVLLNFVRMNKGFALLTGEAGTGKSMVMAYLTGRLPEAVHPVRVSGPEEGYCGILKTAAGMLGLSKRACSVQELADAVKGGLTEDGRGAERFLVIVEDCHRFSDEGIESIRLLGNIEAPDRKLFQILFVGHPEFRERLNRPEMRQVRQRLNVIRTLSPMDESETTSYADFRLKAVGASFEGCFEDGCKRRLFRSTQGVPAGINRLCDAALGICAGRDGKKVGLQDLKDAAEKLRNAGFRMEGSGLLKGVLPLKFLRLPALGAAAVAVVLMGIYGYQGRIGALHVPQAAVPAKNPEPVSAPVPAVSVAENSEKAASPVPVTADTAADEAVSAKAAEPLPEQKAWKVAMSSLVSVKASPAKQPPPVQHRSRRVTVKKGDTLIGIAAKYFPENTAAGIRSIRAANPDMDAGGRIYAGRKLIIPGP